MASDAYDAEILLAEDVAALCLSEIPVAHGDIDQAASSCTIFQATDADGKSIEFTGASHSSEVASALADDRSWTCAICINPIPVEEVAQIKGCEHLYCVNCILRWASYKQSAWCPQCRTPFDMLYSYRTLEGSINDFMSEEAVCLLLCAKWFKPLPREETEEAEDCYYVEDDEDDYYEEVGRSLRIGNRRWGENGYVRNGRIQARPVVHSPKPTHKHSNHAGASGSKAGSSRSKASPSSVASGASPSAAGNASSSGTPLGRRARRAQQRAMADAAAGTSC